MKILVIQENGRHEKNRQFRECFSLQRSFRKLEHECDVWGLGHDNYDTPPLFDDYDVLINLENYDQTNWIPDLSKVNCDKYLWSIDAHVRGIEPYKEEFKRGGYKKILQSTLQLVDQDSIWFPNAYDDTLLYPLEVEKTVEVGFCGNINNRGELISFLKQLYPSFKEDVMVIGSDMVRAINSYKVHFNCNIGIDINYRSFETIGCKTALLTNYNSEYEELGFRDGFNCMLYRNVMELESKLKQLLSDDDLLETITSRGYELAEEHTYLKRCEYLLDLIQ